MTSREHRELADLAARIKAVRDGQGKPGAQRRQARRADRAHRGMAAGLSLAFRVTTELAVGLAFGILAGRGVDWLFGTAPWGTLLLLVLGMAAGIRNVILAVERFERRHGGQAGAAPPASDAAAPQTTPAGMPAASTPRNGAPQDEAAAPPAAIRQKTSEFRR